MEPDTRPWPNRVLALAAALAFIALAAMEVYLSSLRVVAP